MLLVNSSHASGWRCFTICLRRLCCVLPHLLRVLIVLLLLPMLVLLLVPVVAMVAWLLLKMMLMLKIMLMPTAAGVFDSVAADNGRCGRVDTGIGTRHRLNGVSQMQRIEWWLEGRCCRCGRVNTDIGMMMHATHSTL
jgi:hypothetical protein